MYLLKQMKRSRDFLPLHNIKFIFTIRNNNMTKGKYLWQFPKKIGSKQAYLITIWNYSVLSCITAVIMIIMASNLWGCFKLCEVSMKHLEQYTVSTIDVFIKSTNEVK